MKRWCLLVVLSVACQPGPPPDRFFRFSNGVRLRVASTGEVALEDGDRALAAIPAGLGPVVRTFDESVRGDLGIFDFRRTDVVEVDLFPLGVPAAAESDQVLIEYAGEHDEVRGTLAIEADGAERTRLRFMLTAGAADSIAIPFRCDAGGSFHGFGEQYNGTDQRGEAFQLLVSEQGIGRDGSLRALTGDEHTTYFPMPYWVDARGFGVLFETDYRVDVDLCSSDASVAWIEVNSGEPVEWVVFHGPRPLDVVRQLGERLGRPAPLPDWAFGLWVGAQGGRDEVMAEVDSLEAAEIPVAALWVQDWTGVRRNIGGGFGVQYRWEADEDHYPDLASMIDELHARGYRFLGYANPFVDPALPNHFAEMEAMGLLIESEDGGAYRFPAPNIEASHPDLTNPAARAYVRAAFEAMVALGMDGWMLDFGEWNPLDAVLSDGSDPRAFHNRFPVEWQRVCREALDAARPDGDYAFFARSGWTGSQGVAQIHWAGDQEASWSLTDGLPTVVPALLNLGLAGQPHVTHDVAGFSGGPSTKELFMRWTELGAFTPIFRTHEGNDRLNNWSWDRDAETTAHFRRFARIHEALAPLFRRLADDAQRSSAPIVRHLMLQFPEDPQTWGLSDEFLLGEALLVAPVTTEGARSRQVYLPAGTWFHVWTGATFEGPATVEVDAPLGQPPVFSLGEDRADLRAIE